MWPIHTHGFSLPKMLDTGVTRSFVSRKPAETLPATIQPTNPLAIILPMGKALVGILAIQLDMLIDDLSIHNITIYYLLQTN